MANASVAGMGSGFAATAADMMDVEDLDDGLGLARAVQLADPVAMTTARRTGNVSDARTVLDLAAGSVDLKSITKPLLR